MSKKKSIWPFVAGVGLGVGAGMLFAPKKGEELRKDVKNKIDELINKAKEIDVDEVKDEFMKRIDEVKAELEDLDKEKALAIAKKKGNELKEKAEDLVEYAREKGTPVLEKAAKEVRQKAIMVTREVLKRLEDEEEK